MSFGRGGGRGGRGGRGGGGGGGGRGGIADLSLGTLSFADLLATSRADIGDVLYPTAGVNMPATELPSLLEGSTVASSVDRWLYPSHPASRKRWVIEGELKAAPGSKKAKQSTSLPTPFLHKFSDLDIQPQQHCESWLYSDRYKASDSMNDANQKRPGISADYSEQSDYRLLLDKRFFPPDLWTSFIEGKKRTALGTKRAKLKKSGGKQGLAGLEDDGEGPEDGDGEKDDEEGDEEAGAVEEEEVDEDDPDYNNHYFDNGEDEDGMGSGGEGGDEGGVF